MKYSFLKKNIRGFTLVELIICVAIFVFLTGLVVTKYSTFNSSILLTNLAYDVALTVRTAQSYGLNVRSIPGTSGTPYSNTYDSPFGVNMPVRTGNLTFGTSIDLFADTSPTGGDGIYTPTADALITTSAFKNGMMFWGACAGQGKCGGAAGTWCTTDSQGYYGAGAVSCPNTSTGVSSCTTGVHFLKTMSTTYKRPDPTAIITDQCGARYTYLEVYFRSPNGSVKKMIIRKNGQISVAE